MGPDSSHVDVEDRVLVALGETVSPDVAAHLAACAQCRADVDSLSGVVAVGRELSPADDPVQPPDELGLLVSAAVLSSASPAPGRASASARARRDGSARRDRRITVKFAALAAVAAAVVGVMLGGAAVAFVEQQDKGVEVVAKAALAPLPGDEGAGAPGVGSPATGVAEVALSGAQESLTVSTQDLAQPLGFYEVWLLDVQSGGMISLGTVPGGSHETRLPLPTGVDLQVFRAVDISDEPLDGQPGHSSVSVLRGTLSG